MVPKSVDIHFYLMVFTVCYVVLSAVFSNVPFKRCIYRMLNIVNVIIISNIRRKTGLAMNKDVDFVSF